MTAPRYDLALAVMLAGLAAGASSAYALDDPAQPAVLVEPPAAAEAADDYDPWQPFNERMFWFNHDVLDRFVLKPVATGWDAVVPDPAQRALGRAFDNLDMPRRLVNNLLQLRRAGRLPQRVREAPAVGDAERHAGAAAAASAGAGGALRESGVAAVRAAHRASGRPPARAVSARARPGGLRGRVARLAG